MTDTSLAAPPQTAADAPLARRVEEEIRAGRIELPVLPEVANRVREIVAREGEIREIVAVIEKEPSLAMVLLRYANSVAYAGLREITGLHQAITRLGLVAVEQTILAISARNVFKGADPKDEQLLRTIWNHSIATALAARRLASRVSSLSPESAFLAGLLHDIGKVVVLRCVSGMRRQQGPAFAIEQATLLEFFDSLHCPMGDLFCEKWNIPREIREVVRRHHEEGLGPADSLIAVVALADRMAAKIGASLAPDPAISLLESPGASLLRVDDLHLANMLVDVEDDLQRIVEAL